MNRDSFKSKNDRFARRVSVTMNEGETRTGSGNIAGTMETI